MKKYLMTFAGLMFAACAAFGADANGNIRSIDAMPQYATAISFPNKNTPLTSVGQKVYILVRMLNADWDETIAGEADVHPWYFKPSKYAIGSQLTADAMNLPALGISVGGQPRQAVYTTIGPNGEQSGPCQQLGTDGKPFVWYTDFYFVYTVQAGDIGLPVKLLNSKMKISETAGDNSDYLLYNANTAGAEKFAIWDLTNDATGELAQFHFGPENPVTDGGISPGYPALPHTTPHRAFDFASEGVYIRTIDFDGDYEDKESDPKIWREVQFGTDDPYSIEAAVEGAVTGAVVYVWSDDETKVVPTARGNAVILDPDDVDDPKIKELIQSRTIARVTLTEGRGTFGLKGKGAVGDTVKIFMSPLVAESYSDVGDKIDASTCSRWVKVREAPKPHITVCTYASEETKLTVTAVEDYENSPTVMKVMVSERFTEDPIEINLNPAFIRGNVPVTDDDPLTNRYVCILTETGDPSTAVGTNRITIARGTDREATFYLYALGAPADRTMSKMTLTPTIDDAAQWEKYKYGNNRAATITLVDQAPVVTTPMDGALFTAFNGDVINDLSVGIADNWRDLQEAFNTNGYTVTVSFPNGGESFTTNGVHFTEGGDSIAIPVKAPTEGEYPALITVKDPAGHTGTRTVTVKAAHALEAKIRAYTDASLTEAYPEGYVFKEGDMPYVRVELSSAATSPMYAYLRPQNAAASNLVTCAAVTNGLAIASSDTFSSAVAIEFKDGYKTLDPMRASFAVGLLSTETWTPETAIDYTTTYAPRTREFAVVNVAPSIKPGTMKMNTTYVNNGEKLNAKAPASSRVTFSANVFDPSFADLTATNDKAIIAKWVYTDGVTGSKSDHTVFTTNQNRRVSCPVTFFEEGQTQTVKVYLLDKDQRAEQGLDLLPEEYDWDENNPAYTFSVEVSQSAAVRILDANGDVPETMVYNETDTKSKAFFYVQLSANPSDAGTAVGSPSINANNPIEVELTLENWGSDGFLSLATNIVTLADANRKKVYFDEVGLNGGYDTYYQISARVITDSCSNAYDQAWCDYYGGCSSEVMVYNADPLINSVRRTNGTLIEAGKGTNRWASGETVILNWSIKDIIPDITNERFSVSWSIDSGDSLRFPNPFVFTNGIPYTANGKQGTVSGTYQFTVQEGDTELVMTIDDGDGGTAEKHWDIYVAPTKKISITPFGPAPSTETKYDVYTGRGIGHIYVEQSTGISLVRNFTQIWNFSESTKQAWVFAAGYKANPGAAYDTGSIDAGYKGAPLTPSGSHWTSGDRYDYGHSAYDNFFYTWVTIPEDGGVTVLPPQVAKKSGQIKDKYFNLDNEKPEDGAGYGTTRIEAIFSKEMFPGDNLGDINQDYIPDVYAIMFDALGAYGADGSIVNDRLNLMNANDDGDYLPNTIDAVYAHFIPGLSNSWVTTGRPFTARLELRGWDNNFNDATASILSDGAPNFVAIPEAKPERIYDNPTINTNSTLSYLEWVSFTNYCDRAGLGSPLNPSNWLKWSPERPSDPTLSDTDGDGMPDGYEYYFWYKAHVGELKIETRDVEGGGKETVTNLVRLTGRKYNPCSPCEPFEITADEIEKVFDPVLPNDLAAVSDTDNDGLTDLVEFEIGTNPLDYDTDNDGLPDGWEVLMSSDKCPLDPLKAATRPGTNDGSGNQDGDQMACYFVDAYQAKVVYTNDLSTTNIIYVLPSEDYPNNRPALEEEDEIGRPFSTADGKRMTIVKGFLYRAGEIPEYTLSQIIADERLDEQAYQKAVGAIRVVAPISVNQEDLAHLSIMHWNVMTFQGFHPHTAWKKPIRPTTWPGHTSTFSTYDEFMLMAYYHQAGVVSADDITANPNKTYMTIWPNYTTNPGNADTDRDGMPDGWELYIQGRDTPNSAYSPLRDFATVTAPLDDPDYDGLNVREEFEGIDCCAEYSDTETIVNHRPDWRNKKWPTDPFFPDTDGDGLLDGEEYTWLYGSSGVDGGGLNPHSMDTDLDGLPDPWELEFSDTYMVGTSTSVKRETTGEGTNAVTTVTTNQTSDVTFLGRGMNPTRADATLDYDQDGLQNWQEYMVGAMRCWRYDDTASPWQVQKMTNEKLDNILSDPQQFAEAILDPWTVTVEDGGAAVSVRLRTQTFNPGFVTGFYNMGYYFTCCNNDFDPAYDYSHSQSRWYMLKDGIYHDLNDNVNGELNAYGKKFKRGFKGLQEYKSGSEVWRLNRWTAPYIAANMSPVSVNYTILSGGNNIKNSLYPRRYISCDPGLADTDGDGMDDYYELFHGLNPLLGAAGSEGRDGGPRDIIYIAYGGFDAGAPHALANYWLENLGSWIRHHSIHLPDIRDRLEDMADAGLVKDSEMTGLCFYEFPWLTGLATADVDGDNIRNQQEAILPNPQAAPTYLHTDPSPLWLTDSDYTNSLTYCFYGIERPYWVKPVDYPVTVTDPRIIYDGKVFHFKDIPWIKYEAITHNMRVNYNLNWWNRSDWLYDFEENEGYDSDHDYLSDFEEGEARTKPASSPQVHDDPIRHQAMYFNGTDAFLQTPLPDPLVLPSSEAASENRQDLLYFTAEAWVKPDAEMLTADGFHTVLERVLYTGMAGPADERYLRRNFYIGIKGGRWYGYFDSTGTDDKHWVAIEDGPLVSTNWTHVALSYGPAENNELDPEEPMMLRLYINGNCVSTKMTSLQPEHGTASLIIRDLGGNFASAIWGNTSASGRLLTSFLIGASAQTRNGICFDSAWDLREPSNDSETIVPVPWAGTTLDDYSSFFKGYIDEVRIWDGARKAVDILSDVQNKVRYSFEDVEANRQLVYNAWAEGVRRLAPGTDGKQLPAEIRYHWAFDHLPGAVEIDDILVSPAGFTTARMVPDAMALWSRPDGWTSPWWESVGVRSYVYTDTAWIPWINNTVAHVKNMDGTTFDTVFWTEGHCGVSPASQFGYAKFAFPRKAEVASRIHQNTYLEGDELFSPSTRWMETTNIVDRQKFAFTRRNYNQVGSDLLPMGGAYPKRISTTEGGMWDDGVAADAWAETGADADNNGLPDWWERYARRNYSASIDPGVPFDRNATVIYDGEKISAGQAYLRDLAKGILPDGEYHDGVNTPDDYRDMRDADEDGMPDWWENMYNVNTYSPEDAKADSDGDGLSNLAEYRISEVFKYARCNPTLEKTDGLCIDYYLKVGSLYLGEIFSDHDQVNDLWEDKYMRVTPDTANEYFASRAFFDPFNDFDHDGWSNYAEYRAGTDPTTAQALSIDGYTCPEYPLPVIEANILYNGSDKVTGSLIFQAWSQKNDRDMVKMPAATWTLGTSEATTASQDGTNQSSANTQGSALQDHEKFIGRKPQGERTFYLTGGNVSEGSVKLLFLDKGYGLATYDPFTQMFYAVGVGEPDEALWYYGIIDRGGKLVRMGGSIDKALGEDEVVVGSVDYVTGRVTINFDSEELSGMQAADPGEGQSSSSGGSDKKTDDSTDSNIYHWVDLDNSYWRIEWKSSQAMMAATGVHYFSEPDEGHLVEGPHSFVCFADADGDGKYTPGELFGFVRDVDVGWSSAKFTVELTETSPIFGRVDLLTGMNDRAVWYGIDSGNVTNMVYQGMEASSSADSETEDAGGVAVDSTLSGGKLQHVRIDRYAVNGIPLGITTNQINLADRVLVDKWINLNARSYLHEGDILEPDVFDIDWKYFQDDIASDPVVLRRFGGAVNSVTYRVVIDNADMVHPALSNRVLSVAFTRWFDATHQKPNGLESMIVYGARPTFRWSMKDANGQVLNSYTAFRLRILDKADEIVYESPMTRAPALDGDGNYVWTAPFSVGDQTSLGRMLELAGDYKWTVSMYNTKFQTDAYAAAMPFVVSVNRNQPMNDNGYGSIDVGVKYAGPVEVLADCTNLSNVTGKIRVQAYSTPDFAGLPMAQTVVTNVALVTDVSNHTANVRLSGLPVGEYYLRAYIDLNGNFVKDDFESWGSVRTLVKVSTALNVPFAELYIEDADTDGDWIPDAWEYVTQDGSLTALNPLLDTEGRVVIGGTLYNSSGTQTQLLGDPSMAFFQNLNTARVMLSQNSLMSADPSVDAIQAIQDILAKKIEPGTLKISSLEVDAAAKKIVLGVNGAVADSDAIAILPYTLTTPTKVTIRIKRKNAVVEETWTKVKDVLVEINENLDQTIEVPMGDLDFNSGFYSIEVVQ